MSSRTRLFPGHGHYARSWAWKFNACQGSHGLQWCVDLCSVKYEASYQGCQVCQGCEGCGGCETRDHVITVRVVERSNPERVIDVLQFSKWRAAKYPQTLHQSIYLCFSWSLFHRRGLVHKIIRTTCKSRATVIPCLRECHSSFRARRYQPTETRNTTKGHPFSHRRVTGRICSLFRIGRHSNQRLRAHSVQAGVAVM